MLMISLLQMTMKMASKTGYEVQQEKHLVVEAKYKPPGILRVSNFLLVKILNTYCCLTTTSISNKSKIFIKATATLCG